MALREQIIGCMTAKRLMNGEEDLKVEDNATTRYIVFKTKKSCVNRTLDKEGAEFPLSRRMDVSAVSHDIAHEKACVIPPRVYIKPHEPLASKLKAGQDSSATSLQNNYTIFLCPQQKS